MLKALAFGLGVGAGVQAWRNWPSTSLVTADAMAVVFVVGLLSAYFAGRFRGRGNVSATATATAVAEAVATNTVNLAVVVPGGGAGAAASPFSVPSDAAPWIASTTTTPQLTGDQLEGMDLDELLDERDTQGA